MFDFWNEWYWNHPIYGKGFYWDTDAPGFLFVDWGSGGGPERAAEEVPETPRPRKWHDRELEHELELWFEERRKYGRIYLLEPEPERIVLPEPEVRPVFIPYEPPPVRDDTAERLALAAQRAQEAVAQLVARSEEAARRTTEAALAKIDDMEARRVIVAAMAIMEE